MLASRGNPVKEGGEMTSGKNVWYKAMWKGDSYDDK
jgi:hypothetical protein